MSNPFRGPQQIADLMGMVGPSGLEPPTSRLSVVRSSQLSYGPMQGPVTDGTRQVAREYVLQSKTFPAGGIHFRRGCQIPNGAPSKSQI